MPAAAMLPRVGVQLVSHAQPRGEACPPPHTDLPRSLCPWYQNVPACLVHKGEADVIERKVLLVAFLEKRSAPGHAGPQEEEAPEWSGRRTRRKHGQAAFLCVFMAKAKMGGGRV